MTVVITWYYLGNFHNQLQVVDIDNTTVYSKSVNIKWFQLQNEKKRKIVQLSNFAQDLNLETLILVNIFCWNLWHMSDSLSMKIITNLQHIDKLSLPVFFSKRDKLLFRLRERDILGNNNFIKRRAFFCLFKDECFYCSSMFFPHSWLIIGFVTRATRLVLLVVQGLLTLPEQPRFLVWLVLFDLQFSV